jgi:beta-phosphoglucomutase-like phosphatase (HAD superfamily)
MKSVVSALLALGLIAGTVAEANALVCARGVYRAGCAGYHGAAVVHRPYAAAVVRPAPHCYWRAGVRVCR